MTTLGIAERTESGADRFYALCPAGSNAETGSRSGAGVLPRTA